MDLKQKELHLTPAKIKMFEQLGLYDTDDVLRYYPFRYEQLNALPFSQWKVKEKVTFECVVVSSVRSFRKGRFVRSSFQASFEDRILNIVIFNRPWASSLKEGQILTVQGVYNGKESVTAINYDMKQLEDHQDVTPVYASHNGMKQKSIRDGIERVYEAVQNEIYDEIPESLIQKYRLLRKSDALRRIHFPEDMNDVTLAKRTLKYEEFLRFFVSLEFLKSEGVNSIYKTPKIFDQQRFQDVMNQLPFTLTPGQKQALNDILKDMSSTHPMYRLVQGDVGCGKTVVACLCLYACALSNMQSALLAPTEILARQHLETCRRFIQDPSIRIEVLYSGLPEKEKNRIMQETAEGKIDILIGTHSLLQDDLTFANLGFIVADEQQRFGVEQRKALRTKGRAVDFLLMSATPIPRTLASTIFGDMDVTTIETVPQGRKQPITKRISENSFRSVLSDVEELLASGRQLYVICAAVEENENYDARNVEDTQTALQKQFPQYNVGILHGRMNSEEKQNIMQQFADNELQILVSTTVVEVGMNVVNATGMIIYDADRFGLSQLHQLRGRIQRGDQQGQCWLLTSNQDDKVTDRLDVLVRSNDGFEISREDLRLRGPGDILGTRQSGVPDFILGNLVEDTNIIATARKDAAEIISHPDHPDYALIIDSVRKQSDTHRAYRD